MTRITKQSEESANGGHAYFLLRLEYQLMKIIQYMNSNATILIQYGFSRTGFGSVLRYAITLIVTITESAATTIFRSLPLSILLFSFIDNYYFFLCIFISGVPKPIAYNISQICEVLLCRIWVKQYLIAEPHICC